MGGRDAAEEVRQEGARRQLHALCASCSQRVHSSQCRTHTQVGGCSQQQGPACHMWTTHTVLYDTECPASTLLIPKQRAPTDN